MRDRSLTGKVRLFCLTILLVFQPQPSPQLLASQGSPFKLYSDYVDLLTNLKLEYLGMYTYYVLHLLQT